MRRSERLGTVSLSAVEKQALASLAQTEGRSQAAMVRRLIRQAAEARGLWPMPTRQDCTGEEVMPLANTTRPDPTKLRHQ